MGIIQDRLTELVDELTDGKSAVFAKKTDIPQSTFHNYIKGRLPHAEHLIRIHETFNVSIDWLLTGIGEKYVTSDVHAENTKNVPIDLDNLQSIIEGVEEVCEHEKLELKPDKKARLISLLYELYMEDKEVDKKTIVKYLRLAA